MSSVLSPVIGVELTGDSARAVALSVIRRGVTGTAEVPFDPARPADAVRALRESLGPASALGVAVGFAHLHVKAVRLPPVTRAGQLAILALEPDRFFPVAGPQAVAVCAPGLACATDAADLERWSEAFAEWARVAAIVAAPSAAALALEGEAADGTIALPDELPAGQAALLELQQGRLTGARRLPDGVSVDAVAMPAVHGVPPRFGVALGAALSIGAPLHDQLLSRALRERIGGARMRRTAAALAALVASTLFLVFALDHERERTLARTEQAVAQLADSAAPALALMTRLSTLRRETQTPGAAGSTTPDALQVLASLSERLPRDATVLALAADGDAWRLDGRAGNAAAIVPALDADPRFADVRLAGPTTRFTEGAHAYESFSVAFRARPAR